MSSADATTRHSPQKNGNGAKAHILITVLSLLAMGVAGMVLTEYRVGALEQQQEKAGARAAKRDEAIAVLATAQARLFERVNTGEREIDRLRGPP